MNELRSFVVRSLPLEGEVGAAVEATFRNEDSPVKMLVRDPREGGVSYEFEGNLGKELVVKRLLSWITRDDGASIVFSGITGPCEVADDGEFVWGTIDRNRESAEISVSTNKPPHLSYPLFA